MFLGDLAVFFEGEFAETITILQEQVVPLSVQGIFISDVETLSAYQMQVETSQVQLMVRTADVLYVKRGDSVERANTFYTIVGIRHDGYGITTFDLGYKCE